MEKIDNSKLLDKICFEFWHISITLGLPILLSILMFFGVEYTLDKDDNWIDFLGRKTSVTIHLIIEFIVNLLSIRSLKIVIDDYFNNFGKNEEKKHFAQFSFNFIKFVLYKFILLRCLIVSAIVPLIFMLVHFIYSSASTAENIFGSLIVFYLILLASLTFYLLPFFCTMNFLIVKDKSSSFKDLIISSAKTSHGKIWKFWGMIILNIFHIIKYCVAHLIFSFKNIILTSLIFDLVGICCQCILLGKFEFSDFMPYFYYSCLFVFCVLYINLSVFTFNQKIMSSSV